MKILAPAKINVVLKVKGRLENGYHELFMLNEKLNVCDEITVEKSGAIKISCDDPVVPCDETNICFKASKALGVGADIHINKKIPVAAGLGGGSSDAAAVLKCLNELYRLNLPVEKLAEVGVKLGADVPFFLYDGPAICEGIGDKVTALNKLPNMWILLINPKFGVSTKKVYEDYDKLGEMRLTGVGGSDSSSPPCRAGCFFRDLGELAKVVHNDLEQVTARQYPEIDRIKKTLVENGAAISWMSGSGPTVVGLFESEKARNVATGKLDKHGWRVIAAENF